MSLDFEYSTQMDFMMENENEVSDQNSGYDFYHQDYTIPQNLNMDHNPSWQGPQGPQGGPEEKMVQQEFDMLDVPENCVSLSPDWNSNSGYGLVLDDQQNSEYVDEWSELIENCTNPTTCDANVIQGYDNQVDHLATWVPTLEIPRPPKKISSARRMGPATRSRKSNKRPQTIPPVSPDMKVLYIQLHGDIPYAARSNLRKAIHGLLLAKGWISALACTSSVYFKKTSEGDSDETLAREVQEAIDTRSDLAARNFHFVIMNPVISNVE